MSLARTSTATAVAMLVIVLASALRFESARHEATGLKSKCSISQKIDCDKVQASDYASVLGVPLSVWAAAGHMVLIALLWGGALFPAALLAALNLCLSLYLAYVSFFVIDAICLYCSGMQVGIVALAILVVPAGIRAPRTGWARAGVHAALFVALAFPAEAYALQKSRLARLNQPSETVQDRVDVDFAPILGDPRTPVSVLLFLDFGCPHCKRCFARAVDLVAKQPSRFHFIVKHYPLDICNDHEKNFAAHPGACIAAWACAAAAREGGGEKALHYLFAQPEFFPQILEKLGPRIGATDRAKWRKAITGAEAKAIVDRDMDDGYALRIPGVPRVYVNGRPLQDCDRLERMR